jgi:erythromycin esterase-like protein
MRAYDDELPPSASKVGFYCLDLYSLHASMKAMPQYLEKVDPEAPKRARERYACFDHFAGLWVDRRRRRLQVQQGRSHRPARRAAAAGDGNRSARRPAGGEDEAFYAEQNAR